MAFMLTTLLLAIAGLGLLLLAFEVSSAVRHLKQPPPVPHGYPGISVLKPLCGVDDRLEQNLESFAALTYPAHEILLGVEHALDPAYAVARRAAARFPDRMRVVLQRGAPGLNPKVNQLLTLAQAARHELLVVSDSNVAVHPEYLHEIAAHFERPEVGLVTHAIAGGFAQSFGSWLDNAHLSASVGPGMIAANLVAKQPLVVGKSMAMRRSALAAIGGFEAVKDVLAEDFIIGELLAAAGWQIAVAHRAVVNVSCRRTFRSFIERYVRWNVLQRHAVGTGLYSAASLVNPLPFAFFALLLSPTPRVALAVLGCLAGKAVLESWVTRTLDPQRSLWRGIAIMPFKDLLLFTTWSIALVKSEVRWRGRRFAVVSGTRLVPLTSTGSWFARKAAAARARI